MCIFLFKKNNGRNVLLFLFRSVEHADGQSVLTDALWRRYSEFELLRNYLLVYYPHVVVPPLPEKRVRSEMQQLPGSGVGTFLMMLCLPRQNLCGTNSLLTTWIQTLWRDDGLA